MVCKQAASFRMYIGKVSRNYYLQTSAAVMVHKSAERRGLAQGVVAKIRWLLLLLLLTLRRESLDISSVRTQWLLSRAKMPNYTKDCTTSNGAFFAKAADIMTLINLLKKIVLDDVVWYWGQKSYKGTWRNQYFQSKEFIFKRGWWNSNLLMKPENSFFESHKNRWKILIG